MPSPLIHTAAAATISALCLKPNKDLKTTGVGFFWMMIACNLADFDFIPGLISGDAMKFHHHPLSHNLMLPLFAAFFLSYLPLRSFPNSRISRYWIFSAAALSHPLLDATLFDPTGRCTAELCGIQLFWPFSDAKYFNVFSFFESSRLGPSVSSWSNGFNAHIILREFLIGSVAVLTAALIRKTLRRSVLASKPSPL